VVAVIDGLLDQPPGKMPSDIAIEEADGNSIVLDLGSGRYALYAHLRAGSIMVKAGDRVQRGQAIARVGNSGNTLAPHLHFHVMDTPSPLASNGLPLFNRCVSGHGRDLGHGGVRQGGGGRHAPRNHASCTTARDAECAAARPAGNQF
jgi:murein DD-endopeptidase MepM/ murein hydrolase activator NlpD